MSAFARMFLGLGLLGGCWSAETDPCADGVWDAWYEDADGDGYGDPAAPLRGEGGRLICVAPDPASTYYPGGQTDVYQAA